MIRTVFTGLIPSDSVETETEFIVENNYPNPMVRGYQNTTIGYSIPEEGEIKLLIYNSLGQKVAQKNTNTINKGQITWNVLGDNGTLAAGIYFYQIQFRGNSSGKILKSGFKKMILL
ncbi:MAG: T9SS type A sorting domain-containing protein [Calditrichota bacterium]